MGQSVVLDEAEMSKATNQITAYADLLARTIEEYRKILMEVPADKALVDTYINAELIKLIAQIISYKFHIKDISGDARKAVKSMFSEVEATDNFKYPGEFMASISALLADFM